jgi:hypothetical protein
MRTSRRVPTTRRIAPRTRGAMIQAIPSRPRTGPSDPILVQGFTPGGRNRIRRGDIPDREYRQVGEGSSIVRCGLGTLRGCGIAADRLGARDA